IHQELNVKLSIKYPKSSESETYHELFIDYIAYEFLYFVMVQCYSQMNERKNLFVKAAAELLQVFFCYLFCFAIMSPQAAGIMVSGGMQRYWKEYIKHSHGDGDNQTVENKSNTEQEPSLVTSQFSRTNIDDLIVRTIHTAVANYADWTFLSESQTHDALEKFVAKCCEICWLMILMKPVPLIFYPNNPDDRQVNEPVPMDKESLHKKLSFVYGSVDTCNNVLYYAIPALVVDGHHEVLSPPTAFTHQDEAVIDAISRFLKNPHKTGVQSLQEIVQSNDAVSEP
ncbi:hypothetical protein RFI_12988, partial [Reticulomyxa filosa]